MGYETAQPEDKSFLFWLSTGNSLLNPVGGELSREMTAGKILAQFPESVAATGSGLRQFLLRQLKGVTEQPDPTANVIGYNYGAGYKDLICTIILSKKGIKLGFYKGSELPDPKKLLTGSGKVHRYVEINSEEIFGIRRC